MQLAHWTTLRPSPSIPLKIGSKVGCYNQPRIKNVGVGCNSRLWTHFSEVWMEQLCPMGKLYRPYIIIQIVIQLTSKTAQAEQQKRFSEDVKFTKKCTKTGFCQFFPETIRTFTFPLVQRWPFIIYPKWVIRQTRPCKWSKFPQKTTCKLSFTVEKYIRGYYFMAVKYST